MSVLLLVLLALLIAINGFFVAAEFALVRTRRGKIEQAVEEGEAGAEAVVEQLDRIDESLSACQIGITMASIGIGFLGEPSLAKLLEPLFGGLSHAAAAGLSLAIAFAFVTALHISIGEQVPKMLAIAQPDRTARRISRPLGWFALATTPVTKALSEGPDAPLETVTRDALIVPETRPLDDLLHDLQVQRTSLSVVVDEYGRTVGIVTVEDILEEVVGEIEDETDPRAAAVRKLTNGDYFVRGHVSLGDLADAGIELPVDTDAYNSVGGYVFGELGRLPKRGDSIVTNGYTIRVEAVRENRIEAVRISGADSDSVRTPA